MSDLDKSNNQNLEENSALFQIIRDCTVKRLSSSINKKFEVKCKEIATRDDFLYGQWMAIILVSGQALQVTFKTHFFNKFARELVSIGIGKSQENITTVMAMDFMREFCNLTAGEIKTKLSLNRVSVGLSLPLITRGFDEVLFSDIVLPTSIRDWWALDWQGGHIICSAEVEIFQTETAQRIKAPKNSEMLSEEDEGDVDFL